jgi:hypothetical protein
MVSPRDAHALSIIDRASTPSSDNNFFCVASLAVTPAVMVIVQTSNCHHPTLAALTSQSKRTSSRLLAMPNF